MDDLGMEYNVNAQKEKGREYEDRIRKAQEKISEAVIENI